METLLHIQSSKKARCENHSETKRCRKDRIQAGLPQVFDDYNLEWKSERERLTALLTPEELDSARATTLNAHYTSPTVISAMYAALQRFGFECGRILEPACGLGHYIGVMTEEMHSRSQITGIEIDSITARLAKALYPDADIRHQPFEEAKLAVAGV